MERSVSCCIHGIRDSGSERGRGAAVLGLRHRYRLYQVERRGFHVSAVWVSVSRSCRRELTGQEGSMPTDLRVYRWTCPICGQASQGITSGESMSGEQEARNALLGHLRSTAGDRHGETGELPTGVDVQSVLDHVTFYEEIGEQPLRILRWNGWTTRACRLTELASLFFPSSSGDEPSVLRRFDALERANRNSRRT